MQQETYSIPVRLVDPIEFFKSEYPEAFDILPEGEKDLLPEIHEMIELADSHGLQVVHDDLTGKVFVPLSVARAVYGPPLISMGIEDHIKAVQGTRPSEHSLEGVAA